MFKEGKMEALSPLSREKAFRNGGGAAARRPKEERPESPQTPPREEGTASSLWGLGSLLPSSPTLGAFSGVLPHPLQLFPLKAVP